MIILEYLLLIFATLASSAKALFCKRIGTENGSDRRFYELNSLIFLGAAITAVILSPLIGGVHFSLTTLLLSVVFATSLTLTQILQMYAMRHGPASVTTLIYSFGFLVPIVYGFFALNEAISVYQIVGIFVAALSLVFITDPRVDRRIGKLWLALSLLAALGSGINAVLQKLHRALTPESEIGGFLVLAFLFSSLLSFAASRKFPRAATDSPIVTRIPFTLFSGFAIGVLNNMNLLIAGRLPAVIQFPIYNIGSMILVGLAGKFMFGDKLTAKQTTGFCVGCIAILIIGLL